MSREAKVGWPAAPQRPSTGFPDAPAPAKAPTIEGDGQPGHELKNMENAKPPEAQVSAPTATQRRPAGVPDAHIDDGPAPAKAFATEGDGQPADGPPRNKRQKSRIESQLEIAEKAYEFDQMRCRGVAKKYAGLGFTESGSKDAIERLKKKTAPWSGRQGLDARQNVERRRTLGRRKCSKKTRNRRPETLSAKQVSLSAAGKGRSGQGGRETKFAGIGDPRPPAPSCAPFPRKAATRNL